MAERKKFIYRERTAEDAQKYIERSRFVSYVRPGVDQFKASEGDNIIRILPPTWDEHDHYAYPLHIHSNVGPDNAQYLCLRKHLNKPCPVCEEYERLARAGDVDEAKEIRDGERFACWLIDRNGKNDNPQFYALSMTVNAELLTLAQDKKKGGILMVDHPEKGFDISFRRTGKGKLNTRYTAWRIDRDSTPIIDGNRRRQEEILDFIMENPIPSVLKFFSYDHIKTALMGGAIIDEERQASASDESPQRSGKYADREEHNNRDEDDEKYVSPRDRRASAVHDDEEQIDDDERDDDREPPWESAPVQARRIVRK